MRVVLDTNILISACWTPGGLEAQLISMVSQGELVAFVSTAVLAEYREVLFRPKFTALRVSADDLLRMLSTQALVITTAGTLSIASDEDDNRFLECAVAAGAQYLITGNLRHYPPQYGVTKIVNARQFFTERNSV